MSTESPNYNPIIAHIYRGLHTSLAVSWLCPGMAWTGRVLVRPGLAECWPSRVLALPSRVTAWLDRVLAWLTV
jgi:hypothetical protein